MNEKIKELAIKSWLVSEHKGKLLSCYREDVDLTKYLEDFAELIILECADIAGDDWDTAGTAILKHFGVER
jgi:hypothetical protein